MAKIKLIKCSNPDCAGTIAHIIGEKLVELKRSYNEIKIMGKNYMMNATCPHRICGAVTVIQINESKVVEENLRIEEAEEKDLKEETEDQYLTRFKKIESK